MKTFSHYEQQVHAAIDAGDPETLDQYAEHAVDNFDHDLMLDMALAMIKGNDAGKAIALMKIESRIDKQRAEFIEFEAQRRSKAEDEHQAYMAELDSDFRGAA